MIRSSIIVMLFAAFLVACTTNASTPSTSDEELEPLAEETPRISAPTSDERDQREERDEMATVNHDHLHFHDDVDPTETLARIREALQWQSTQPQHAGSPTLGTIEELTQEHYLEVREQNGQLFLHLYPATPPHLWEVTFTINEANQVVDMVTATMADEAPPPVPENFDDL